MSVPREQIAALGGWMSEHQALSKHYLKLFPAQVLVAAAGWFEREGPHIRLDHAIWHER